MVPGINLWAALALAAAGLTGSAWLGWQRVDTLKAEKAALLLQLDACAARAINLNEDKESDDAIDIIPDSDLGNVPERWLVPETGGSGVF